MDAPRFPLLERYVAACGPEGWIATAWTPGRQAPFTVSGRGGEALLLFRTGDDGSGDPEEGDEDQAPEQIDDLVVWRPGPGLPWERAPVLLVAPEGDVDLVAGSVDDLVLLLALAGTDVDELPGDAGALRQVVADLTQDEQRDLERARQAAGIPPADLEALGARIAGARRAHAAALDPGQGRVSSRSPQAWPPAQGPDFAHLLRPQERSASVSAALSAQGLSGIPRRGVPIAVHEAGRLCAPSGRVVVGDVLVGSALVPLPVEVPPGDHPAFVSVAYPEEGHARVAALVVLLDEAPPTRWEQSWSFAVDSGTTAFVDARAYEGWGDDDRPGERLRRALSRARREGREWCQRSLREGATAVLSGSGWGDGEYCAWIGRDARGRAVALLAGFGFIAGDSTEGAPAPPPPLTTPSAMHAVTCGFFDAYNTLLRAGDPTAFTPLLAEDVELVLPEGTARGRDAALAALARRPLGEDPVTFNRRAEDVKAGTRSLEVALGWRPTQKLGVIHLVVRGASAVRVVVERAPPAPEVAPPPPPPGASPEDRRLAEALGGLSVKSPLKRTLIEDLRRQVLTLGRALSEAQRRKGEELLRG